MQSSRGRTVAWDFPLSRAEKLRRVLTLYEAEVKTTREMENTELLMMAREINTERRASYQSCSSSVQADACQLSSQRCLGVLQPSLRGTRTIKASEVADSANLSDDLCRQGLHPVQELQHSYSAVTIICFGQERHLQPYILLAAVSRDGSAVIYRCYRTDMEAAMFSDQNFYSNGDLSSSGGNSKIEVHSRLAGHSNPVTTVLFNQREDELVTASVDMTVRFWAVNSGEIIRCVVAGSPVLSATFLPICPRVLAVATSNASLRVIDVQTGAELQLLRFGTAVQALEFDDTGCCMLAGMQNGQVHGLEASSSGNLQRMFKAQLVGGEVTGLKFVQATFGRVPYVLATTSNACAQIAECLYGPTGMLEGLTPRQSISLPPQLPPYNLEAYSLEPPKCCYSPSGQGCIVAGSSNGEVQILPLVQGLGVQMQRLRHNGPDVPVLFVAVNLQNTLIASADDSGRIVLWRRLDFSHLQDA